MSDFACRFRDLASSQHHHGTNKNGCRQGQPEEAHAILQDLRDRTAVQYVPADYFAVLHLGLGEHDEALTWLERAHRERALHTVFLAVDPLYADLHGERRFDGILRTVGLR